MFMSTIQPGVTDAESVAVRPTSPSITVTTSHSLLQAHSSQLFFLLWCSRYKFLSSLPLLT